MFFFAHGQDPQPLPASELFADWMLAVVALVLAGGLGRLVMAPLFKGADEKKRRELVGWVALGLGILLAMGSWITRQSVVEALSTPAMDMQHAHFLGHGGQVAMWGDYHAEVARVESGEYRLWLSDAYRRTIGTEFYTAQLVPRNAKTGALEEAQAIPFDAGLNGEYRLAQLPRELISVQVRINYPGDEIKLNFVFDGSRGKRSQMNWCGP